MPLNVITAHTLKRGRRPSSSLLFDIGGYQMGRAPRYEEQVFATAQNRHIVLSSKAVDRNYWFFVQAYRRVDPDVAPFGIILGSPVRAKKYSPASEPIWSGDIRGSIEGQSTGQIVEKLSGIQEGADVTADQQISIEVSPTKSFQANYAGVIAAGLPWTISPTVLRGAVSIKTSAQTTYQIATMGCTAIVDNAVNSGSKGDIALSAVASISAWIDLTVLIEGVPQPAKRVQITRTDAPAPQASSNIATDPTLNSINATAYVALSDTMTITVPAGQKIYVTAAPDYSVAYAGGVGATRTATIKAQYAAAGSGVWTDLGAGVTGSAATSGYIVGFNGEFDYVDEMLGSVSIIQNVAPAAGSYDVRFMALLSATGRNVAFYGTATVEVKA